MANALQNHNDMIATIKQFDPTDQVTRVGETISSLNDQAESRFWLIGDLINTIGVSDELLNALLNIYGLSKPTMKSYAWVCKAWQPHERWGFWYRDVNADKLERTPITYTHFSNLTTIKNDGIDGANCAIETLDKAISEQWTPKQLRLNIARLKGLEPKPKLKNVAEVEATYYQEWDTFDIEEAIQLINGKRYLIKVYEID